MGDNREPTGTWRGRILPDIFVGAVDGESVGVVEEPVTDIAFVLGRGMGVVTVENQCSVFHVGGIVGASRGWREQKEQIDCSVT